MKPLSEIINHTFAKCLKDGIHDAPKDKRFVTVEVSSGHMRVFYEYYDTYEQLEAKKGGEWIDGQCYSNIKLVYDLKDKCIIYYEHGGITDGALDYYNQHKNDPKPNPVYVPPPPQPKHPSVKDDHFCQKDPGENKCYYCGREMNEPL